MRENESASLWRGEEARETGEGGRAGVGEEKWAVPGLSPALSERSGRGLAVRKEGADRQRVTEREREREREPERV